MAVEKMKLLSITGKDTDLEKFLAKNIINLDIQIEDAKKVYKKGWKLEYFSYDYTVKEYIKKCEKVLDELQIEKDDDYWNYNIINSVSEIEKKIDNINNQYTEHINKIVDLEKENELMQKNYDIIKNLVSVDSKIENLYNLNETIARDVFDGCTYPWEVLPKIKDFIIHLGNTLSKEEYDKIGENVWIAKTAKVAPTAYINGPAIIGKNAEVRHCAFIRGNAIVGENAVVGNSTELKNVILFNNVQVPHYNYVGDSILGYKSHMGAGSITSNVKSDKKLVIVKNEEVNFLLTTNSIIHYCFIFCQLYLPVFYKCYLIL